MSHKTLTGFAKIALVAGFVIGVSGCQATSESQQMDQLASDLRQRVERAEKNASDALAAARSASQMAESALSAAQDAQACCDSNRERMDRMFEKLQQK